MSDMMKTAPAQTTKTMQPGGGSAVLQALRDYQVILILLIVMLAVTTVLAPVFFNPQNLINVARQASITGIVAVGMTFVVLTAGIDLSVGAMLALVGILFSLMVKADIAIAIALPAALLVGIAAGAVNGIGATFFGMQPFIMTLATMAIGSGIALLISGGTPIPFTSDDALIALLGNGNIGGVPGPVIVFALVAVIAALVLRYLPFGRFVYGVGGGLEAARLSGVRTARVLIFVYAISGFCAAIAGVITTSRLFVGHPTAGSFITLDSIAAVVIGGTSLMGGRGGIVGTVAGVFLLAMVANLLNLLGVSPFNQQIAKGAIIILAVLFTAHGLRERFAQQWNAL
jgi:ribose transport system permease protein